MKKIREIDDAQDRMNLLVLGLAFGEPMWFSFKTSKSINFGVYLRIMKIEVNSSGKYNNPTIDSGNPDNFVWTITARILKEESKSIRNYQEYSEKNKALAEIIDKFKLLKDEAQPVYLELEFSERWGWQRIKIMYPTVAPCEMDTP